jgi:hypothetical protein
MSFGLSATKVQPVGWVHLTAVLMVLRDKEDFALSGIRIGILGLLAPSCGYCGWCRKHVEQVNVFKVTVPVIFFSIRWNETDATTIVQMPA